MRPRLNTTLSFCHMFRGMMGFCFKHSGEQKKDGNLHLHRLLTFVTLKPVDSICSMDILRICHGVIIIIIYCPRTDSSVLLVDVIFIYRVSFPKSHFEELNRQNHEAIASLQNINHRAGQAIQFLQLLPLVRKQNVDVNSAVCGVLIFSRGLPRETAAVNTLTWRQMSR